jgi:pimeloyl-ACP methyl ester carboxylesterase
MRTTTITEATTSEFAGPVRAGDVELWVEQCGDGPDVLLLAGLSDPVEAWSFQLEGLADAHRLTAFDNRAAGRSPMMPEGFTVMDMADDAAEVLRSLGIERAHVAGFSGGAATAQNLALQHPDLVQSLVLVSTWGRVDAYVRRVMEVLTWLSDVAPSERAMLEAFFLWIYTPRAHDDGVVDQIIDEALAFPHPQTPEGFRRQLAAWAVHDTLDRLHEITVPTLVIAGGIDVMTKPAYGRAVADRIAGSEFVVMADEAHQPFQEVPEQFNALVSEFWQRVDR